MFPAKLDFRWSTSVPLVRTLGGTRLEKMSKGNEAGLLELLKGKGNGANALAALAAKAPAHDPTDADTPAADKKLNDVLNRINQLTGADGRRGETPPAGPQPQSPRAAAAPAAPTAPNPLTVAAAANARTISASDEFLPLEPGTIRDAGLTDSEV